MSGTRMKYSILVLAFMMAASVFGLLGANADTEPNDDFSEAEEITAGTPYSGNVDGSMDYVDFYYFSITAGDIINVTFTCTSMDFGLHLYDEDEGELGYIYGSPGYTQYLDYQTSAETEYSMCYLVAETVDDSSDYTFTLTLTAQDDGGSGGDAPSDLGNGHIVTEGTIVGKVKDYPGNPANDGEDGTDCYKFWAGKGDRINISFTSSAYDFINLTLMEPNDDMIFWILGKNGVMSTDEFWTANETDMGYYLLLIEQDIAPGQYTITLDIERQNDALTNEDAPDDYHIANPVVEGNLQGHLEDDDQYDTFLFMAGNGDVISIGFRGYSNGDQLYFELLDNNGETLTENDSSSADSGIMFNYYTANETLVREFYMKVWMDTAPGNYVITLGIEKQNDAGKGIDVRGDSGTETTLGSGSYEGWIFDLDTADMYRVNLTGGQTLDITLGVSEGGTITLEWINRTLIGSETKTATISEVAHITRYSDKLAGNRTEYIKVHNGKARYSLGIVITEQDDAGSGSDAASSGIDDMKGLSPDPTPLIVNDGINTFWGFLEGSQDEQDTYSLSIEEGKRLNVTVEQVLNLRLELDMYNSTGWLLSSGHRTTSGNVTLEHDFVTAENIQLQITSYVGKANYELKITISDIPVPEDTPSAPTLTATPGAGKITLTWTVPTSDGGSPITGYNIYKKISGSIVPATLLTTVGSSVLTYEDTFVITVIEYEYYVAAENANGEGEASNTVTASPLLPANDTDMDGMPDDWEDDNGLDKTINDAALDKDGDGFSNLKEYQEGTDPQDSSSKPAVVDTDNDGMPDDWEVAHEFNPNNPSDAIGDADNDGWMNRLEYQYNTDPWDPASHPTISDDDDDVDDDDDGIWGSGWPFICCGVLIVVSILLLIIIVIIIIATRSKKKKGAEEE